MSGFRPVLWRTLAADIVFLPLTSSQWLLNSTKMAGDDAKLRSGYKLMFLLVCDVRWWQSGISYLQVDPKLLNLNEIGICWIFLRCYAVTPDKALPTSARKLR
jgi:hypothetical protein